jgi:hypothetical protein
MLSYNFLQIYVSNMDGLKELFSIFIAIAHHHCMPNGW